MRPLWPIERAAIEATAKDNPQLAERILQQADGARVTMFENTGAGFLSTLLIDENPSELPAQSPLDGAHGNVEGIEHGMGFIVFLDKGRISLLEGYSFGDDSTESIDFAKVKFDVRPWSAAQSER